MEKGPVLSPTAAATRVALTASFKEEERLRRWLGSRDPVKRFRALAELEPEFMAEVLREELGDAGSTAATG